MAGQIATGGIHHRLDLPVRHASLVEEAHGLVELGLPATLKLRWSRPDAILVEPVPCRRHRPQAQQQAAADHDDAPEQDRVDLFRGRVTWRR